MIVPRTTADLTRTQLVGMLATLRGTVYTLLHGAPDDAVADRADAEEVLKMTQYDAADADLLPHPDGVCGTFDSSWRADQ